MKSIISGILILAVLAIVVVDGLAVYAAYTTSNEVANSAGQQAALEYVGTGGNLNAAKRVAQDFAESKDTTLVSIEYHKSDARYFTVRTQKLAQTYVLQHIPGMDKLLLQDSTAIVNF